MSLSLEERVQYLEERIAYLQRSVSDVESVLSDFDKAIASVVMAIEAMPDPNSNNPQDTLVSSDRVWNCDKCGARLGVYDPDSEQLRIKYKDFSLYSVAGTGGRITVPCRRCAHLNTLEDDRK